MTNREGEAAHLVVLDLENCHYDIAKRRELLDDTASHSGILESSVTPL
jgi:hypothetical protein